MNAPYPPAPGQPYPPGYPPPRQGMGCFAKGCLATVLVLLALGVLAGVGGWYLYTNVRPFVGNQPVKVRTYPATAAQYSELLGRIQTFQTDLANLRASTLALSADDLNTVIARSPSYEDARGVFYFSIVDNQLVIETSVPVAGDKRQGDHSGRTYYFSGKLYCDASYADGDFAFTVRKIETLAGESAPPFLAAIVATPDFSRGLSRSFNEGFHGALHKNPAGEEFMAKVRTIVVQNDHVVISAGPAP